MLSPKIFDVSPHTNLFQNLGSTGGTIDEAIAELVDNANDSPLGASPVIVAVNYKISKGKVTEIVIEDNAAGMDMEQLALAFTIGHSSKRNEVGKVGYFGFGLKSAITFLGNSWYIETSPPSALYSYAVDDKAFLVGGEWKVEVSTVAKHTANHGTRIVVRDCKVHPTSIQRILANKLAQTFQHFIRSGKLILMVNGVKLQCPNPSVLKDTVITIDTLINGKPVTGWIALQTHSSQGTDYGFDLIRNNRVIASKQEIGFRREPQFSRLIGDISLNTFEVDHGKTSFNRSNDDWVEFSRYMANVVKPLLERARELNTRDTKRLDRNVDKLLSQSLQKLIDSIRQDEFLRDLFGDAATKQQNNDGNVAVPDVLDVAIHKDEVDREPSDNEIIRNVPQGRQPRKSSPLNNIKVRHAFAQDGTEAFRKRWEVCDGVLNVSINMDHPAFPDKDRQYGYALMNTVEALASYLATEQANTDGSGNPNMFQYETILDKLSRISIENSLIVV
jgi:hypothetical protein